MNTYWFRSFFFSSNWWKWLVGIIIPIGIFIIQIIINRSIDKDIFQSCHTIEDYRNFLIKFPESKYTFLVQNRITKFINDSLEYKKCFTIKDFENYIEKNPDSKFIILANHNIEKLNNQKILYESIKKEGIELLKKEEYKKAIKQFEAAKEFREFSYLDSLDSLIKVATDKYNLIHKPLPLKEILKKRNMVLIKGGKFIMGCDSDEFNGEDIEDNPEHEVIISDFYIGKYEVTKELWQEIMNEIPPYNEENKPNYAIINISWLDAIKFCNKLSKIDGLQEYYVINNNEVTINYNKKGYRLPTEAEWEYAARGGQKNHNYTYSGNNDIDLVGWYFTNSETPHSVNTKYSNELGLYHMSGNAAEACWDWYAKDYYLKGNKINPQGAKVGYYKVGRGGSFAHFSYDCTVFTRLKYDPNKEDISLGLRIAY